MKLAVAKVRNFSLLRMLFEYFYDTFRLINIAKERLKNKRVLLLSGWVESYCCKYLPRR